MRTKVLDKFAAKLVNSGHSPQSSRILIVQGVMKYLHKVKLSKLNHDDPSYEPLYLNKTYREDARQCDKYLAKMNWYKSKGRSITTIKTALDDDTIEGGNVVEAPTWHREESLEDHSMCRPEEATELPPHLSDADPDLVRGQGPLWDRVVPCEVSSEGGNQLACDASDLESIDLCGDGESVAMLVLNSDDIEAVECEVDVPSE